MAKTEKWEDFTLNPTLVKFAAELPEIISDASHSEMYGVQLEGSSERYYNRLLPQVLRLTALL